MDRKAKALDVKYRDIYETEKRIRLCQEVLNMLKEPGIPSEAVSQQVAQNEQTLAELTERYANQLQDRVNDFMLIEDAKSLRILNMWYIERLSWEEIAGRLGVTEFWAMKLRDKALDQIVEKEGRGL